VPVTSIQHRHVGHGGLCLLKEYSEDQNSHCGDLLHVHLPYVSITFLKSLLHEQLNSTLSCYQKNEHYASH
jgi:hypothetical protein